ncbi:DUF6701 domain-containing protein [Neptuniibacter sp. QD37_6]|uniref:DUF6701 domain-containing protein n=1 Tax=Neptuniibacter sp. QD37_6 TaxID=3398210 RepID=UPI0039F56D3B
MKFVYRISLLIVVLLQPVLLHAAVCHSDPSGRINELVPQGTAGPIKYVETILIGSEPVDVAGWRLCTNEGGKTPSCVSYGVGNFLIGSFDKFSSPADNGITVYNPVEYLSSAQILNSNEWEVALIDADDLVLDYVHFCKDSCKKTQYWDVPDSCSNELSGGGSNKVIFARKPNGSGDFEEVGDPTPGSSNDGDESDVDHYSIFHDETGVTCLIENITITAHDSSHSAVDAGSASMTIAATSGKGNWVGAVSGTSAFDNGSADDGVATFTFASGSQSAVLQFAHPVLSGTSETFGFNVSDGSITENSGSWVAADDPNITFTLAGFRFIDGAGAEIIPTQIAGKASDAGFGATSLYLQAVEATTADPSVCQAAFPNGTTLSINLAAQCNNPTSCVSGRTFNVQSGSNPEVDLNAGTPETFKSVDMTFDTDSKAPLRLNYNDAGEMQLQASYTVPDTSAVMIGNSNLFVVRPFGFGFPEIDASGTANSGGDETGGAAFTSAGSDFTVDINAYLYEASEDVDVNGMPDGDADVTDNGITPNFTGTVSLSVESFTPADGSPGILSGTVAPLLDTYSNRSGADVTATLNYDEVGSMNLMASLSSYLGADDIQSVATKIGRFYPDHFVMSDDGVAAACSAVDSFTYMQEPFKAFEYRVEARALNGEITENYDLVLYTIGTGSLVVKAENNDDGIDLSDRILVSESLSGWESGVIDRTSASDNELKNVIFTRNGGNAGLPDGPFYGLQLGLGIESEPDSRDFLDSLKNMSVDSSGDCSDSCQSVEVGDPVTIMYGRVSISSVHGPETQDLPVPFEVQYWDGTTFVRNTDDSCTTIPLANISYDGNPISSAVADRTVTVGDGTTVGNLRINGTDSDASTGDFSLIFTAPGAGSGGNDKTGYFPVGLTSIDDWLRYDWDQDGNANDISVPDAIITFGRARGNDRMIFWQERFQ